MVSMLTAEDSLPYSGLILAAFYFGNWRLRSKSSFLKPPIINGIITKIKHRQNKALYNISQTIIYLSLKENPPPPPPPCDCKRRITAMACHVIKERSGEVPGPCQEFN